jgi:hypothetical protein
LLSLRFTLVRLLLLRFPFLTSSLTHTNTHTHARTHTHTHTEGVFGAHMSLDIVNDGPVTVILDSGARETETKRETQTER